MHMAICEHVLRLQDEFHDELNADGHRMLTRLASRLWKDSFTRMPITPLPDAIAEANALLDRAA